MKPSNLPTASLFQIRAVVGLSILLGVFACLLGRLFFVQVVQEKRFTKQADAQQWTRVESVPPLRGRILDREGRALAQTENFPTVAVDPAAIADSVEAPKLVREELGVSATEFAQILAHGGRHFAYVRRQVADRASVERLRARAKSAGVTGFIFQEEEKRIYPQGNVAAHLIGFTDRDGKGIDGIEKMFDEKLAGRPGRRVTLRDARSQEIVTAGEPLVPPVDGEDVTLTLDATIQSFAESAARESFEKFRPTGTVAAVVDVKTGEILGLACYPTYDLSSPGAAPADARRARFFTDIFEPGSTFKPLVMSAAIDSGAVTPNDKFDCDDNHVGKRLIHEDEGHHYGVLDPTGIIARSSNVGMAKVGVRLGINRTYAAVRAYGFGSRTALAWPGESAGQVEPLKAWTETYTLCSVSFGHNIAVTPAQLLMGYATLANDGRRLEPRLVLDAPAKSAPVAVVSAETAATMRPMLEEVLISGTAKGVKKSEYRIGGKTGTAQKLATGGVVGSFACFGPLENPRLAALVICDKPTQNGSHGSVVAAPYCVDMLRQSLRYLGVPRSGDAPAPPAVVAAALDADAGVVMTADPAEESTR
jgi:cell division protein FtsI (penicillin-binding protein 3)